MEQNLSLSSATSVPVSRADLKAMSSATTAHVHGPDCGHSHAEIKEAEVPVTPPKYATVNDVPAQDAKAVFATIGAPIWPRDVGAMVTAVRDRANGVAAGDIRVLLLNNEAYKWLLTSRDFIKGFEPVKTAEQASSCIVGLFHKKLIVMCDALLESEDQVTMPKAMYFGTEVPALKPEVKEVLVEPAEPTGDPVGAESTAESSPATDPV